MRLSRPWCSRLPIRVTGNPRVGAVTRRHVEPAVQEEHVSAGPPRFTIGVVLEGDVEGTSEGEAIGGGRGLHSGGFLACPGVDSMVMTASVAPCKGNKHDISIVLELVATANSHDKIAQLN